MYDYNSPDGNYDQDEELQADIDAEIFDQNEDND